VLSIAVCRSFAGRRENGRRDERRERVGGRMTVFAIALIWTLASMLVSPVVGGWLARRPAELAPAGLGRTSDRGSAAPFDP
jgi:hypothetical protein